MFRKSLLALVALSASATVLADESCTDVVSDTLAEMRVGVGDAWNSDIERLARAAAGAACVKAMSGRYDAMMAEKRVSADALAEEPVANAKAGQAEVGQSSTGKVAEDSDDDSWSFGGLTFKSMSGSPGKKPYERQRQQNKEETGEGAGDDAE